MIQKSSVILVISLLVLFYLPLNASAIISDNTVAVNLPPNQSPEPASWPMAGANPERTSWTPEEVRGSLKPLWFKPFEPYISQKVQVIAAYDTLYISTARGLYALDAETGAEKWVYPTEFPLGHSPTIANGVAYVGGFDRKLHAIDALTGAGLWTFEAEAGFHTNPLVVEGKVYAGNRDGYFYAVYAEGPNTGQLAWKYQTGGPVLFSAAYKDGVVFFASNDSHAYALNAQTGTLVWKSTKLPGAGFHSWWPVVYRDQVIFAGSNNYRNFLKPGLGPPGQVTKLTTVELEEVYPHYKDDPRGTPVGPYGNEPGDWVQNTKTIDTSKPTTTENGNTTPITEYFEQKPWRRTYFVLGRTTGEEYTTDFDNDGKPEYAPILWVGTHSGNRYPPIVGGDGVLYQSNNYMSDPYIAGGHITGWQLSTPFISVPNGGWNAVDEPQAYAAGGNLIYWNRAGDRVGAAFDIAQPGVGWIYFNYYLVDKLPGYYPAYEGSDELPHGDCGYMAFGGINGIYSCHGDQNPPIPYQGKVYMHRGNSIIAFASQAGTATALPMATTVPVQDDITSSSLEQLKAKLEIEVQRIIDAGHLRPGYYSTGEFDFTSRVCGNKWVDYWHNPADTIYTLIMALPYLSPDLQQQTKTYLQNEFTMYPPYQYWHIGWADGATREIFDLPPEVETDRVNFPPEAKNYHAFSGWKFPPHNFYAMWKYAELFGNADQIFSAATGNSYLMDSFNTVPTNSLLEEMPYVHNAYIAGYIGYLELEALAGRPESVNIRNELDRLLALRAQTFSKDTKWDLSVTNYNVRRCRTLNLARNFLFMAPELAQYLHDNAKSKVQDTVDFYNEAAPYWFVSRYENTYNEGVIATAYDYHALFQAKALILQESGEELEKYLDVPAFERGDLFYIQNLVAILNSTLEPPGPTPTPEPTSTPTPGPTSTLTPTPAEGGLVVSNLSVASGKTYVWDTLAVGKKSYIDRDYTFSSIPLPYQGLSYLRTANDDKSRQDNPFITFDVNQNVTVYVVYDNRNSIPAWLSGFADTGDDISGGGFPNQARVLAKDFPAGTIKLGGNENSNNGSMYNVIVKGQGSGATSTPEPTVIPTEPIPNPITLTFDGPNSVAPGEMFSMDVVAQNVPAPGLYGVQFEINYDPTLVSVSNLQANPNLPFVVLNRVDNTAGKITLVASQQGQVSGLTGDVTLLSFQVTAADTEGTATFSFENEKFSDFQAQGFDITAKDYTVAIGQVTTPEPTQEPTPEPTIQPTPEPTIQPTPTPTPTTEPTASPTTEPTAEPTSEPTPNPTGEPTPQPTNADLLGQVVLAGRSENNWSGATVTVDNNKQDVVTDKSGNFNISNLSPGVLNSIKADASGYLSAVCTNVIVIAPETVLTPVTLLSGDITDDDLVDIVDATAVGASFGQTGQGLAADITLDEVVDIFDIVLVSVNFGEEGPQGWNCLNNK